MEGISVIIPVFNKARSVKTCLASVLCQQNVPFELIVVDDGSTDDSSEILKGLQTPLIQIIRTTNRGPSAARNTGVEHARFDHIVFLDADDVLAPNALLLYKRAANTYADADLLIGNFSLQHTAEKIEDVSISARFSSTNALISLTDFDQRAVVYVPSSGFCVSRTLFMAVGGFSEGLWCWEITDLLIRLNISSRRTVIIPETVTVIVRNQTGSQFKVASENPTYKYHYAKSIAQQIKNLPPKERERFLREIQYSAIAQLHHRRLVDFLDLSQEIRRLAPYSPGFQINRWVRTATLAPRFFLKLFRHHKRADPDG